MNTYPAGIVDPVIAAAQAVCNAYFDDSGRTPLPNLMGELSETIAAFFEMQPSSQEWTAEEILAREG